MTRLRIVCVAVVAGLACGTPALAECGARPATPIVPSGATAQIEEMKAASKEIEVFADRMNTYADCMIDSAQSAIDERNDIVQRWNQQTDTFNNRLSSD
jgi:hypothetical protein